MTTEKELLEKMEAVLNDKMPHFDCVCYPECKCGEDEREVIQCAELKSAIKALLPLFQKTEWKYPGKGELPSRKEGWNHSDRVLVYYEGSETQVDQYSIAYYHYDPPFQCAGFIDWTYPDRVVKCWHPLPSPPTQAEP